MNLKTLIAEAKLSSVYNMEAANLEAPVYEQIAPQTAHAALGR